MRIINYLKKQFYKIRFKCEWYRKPWLFATSLGLIPLIIGIVLWDYFFLITGTYALGFWIALSILFLFEDEQSGDE